MKERPIIFSCKMVRAILEKRKTQTRRVIKLKNFEHNTDVPWCEDWMFRDPRGVWNDASTERLIEKYCPYGKPGDRLWVRETYAEEIDEGGGHNFIKYKADSATLKNGYELGFLSQTWKPSIFMPRWASRITLEITNVRVEQVQGISYVGALAEGVWRPGPGADPDKVDREYDAVVEFQRLWNEINAKRGYPWDSNPWVWVIEFKVMTKGRAKP